MTNSSEAYASLSIDRSADGTSKGLISFLDGARVEFCVLDLPYRTTRTVICVSSQAGCPFRCSFCASGYREFIRQLSAAEIVAQVVAGKRLANAEDTFPFDVTYMGSGEPLANFDAVVESFELLLSRFPSIAKFNISTIGPKGTLRRLAAVAPKGKIHIQLSLHSPFDDERRSLFRWPVVGVVESIGDLGVLAASTGDRPCINYLLLRGVNDSARHAEELARIIQKSDCYVKLSSYNEIEESNLIPALPGNREHFRSILISAGIAVTTFDSQGTDVRAGCGQFVADTAGQ